MRPRVCRGTIPHGGVAGQGGTPLTSLRINELVIDGLRSCPRRFPLSLGGKSVCLLGENGHGKTTIADAAELWSTGDLAAFHREGCALEAAIHLDASTATVEVSGSGFTSQRRVLTGAVAGDLEPLGPGTVEGLGPIPILRHATIAGFIGQTAGEKKKALLDLLGLGDLNGLREPLKTASSHAKRDATTAKRQVAAEQAGVESQLGGEDLVAYAEQRRTEAGLDEPIGEPSDIVSVALEMPPAVAPDRTVAVDRIAAALAGIDTAPVGRWNNEVADEAAVRADGMAALLRTARRVLAPEDDACPVCEQPIVGNELAEHLAERAAALEQIRGRLATAAEDLATLGGQLADARAAIAALRRHAPPSGWPQDDLLADVERALDEHRAMIEKARADRIACPPAPALDEVRGLLTKLRAAASANEGAGRTRALIDLAGLRQKCLRLEDSKRRHAAAEQASIAAERILAIADEEIERAIKTAISTLAGLTADYYGRLVRGSPFTDIGLVYKHARSGQVEFSLTFDARHRGVTPPQRIMSTSQQNALGVALHLARLKLDSQPWRTLVLDDVINSFDAPHRQGLARLLVDEFADWQVIVLTHDRGFKEILRRTVRGWQFKEIVAFSARGGPHLSDGDPRVALRERLDEGAVAMEVAHLARRALEQGLATPLWKLGYEIRYDPDQRYSAYDYLSALRRGFKRSSSPLKDLPALARIEADSYMSNLGVHDRLDATALTTDDLYRLVDDLEELDSSLRCSQCEEPVWKDRRRQSGSDNFHCGCGALAA